MSHELRAVMLARRDLSEDDLKTLFYSRVLDEASSLQGIADGCDRLSFGFRIASTDGQSVAVSR